MRLNWEPDPSFIERFLLYRRKPSKCPDQGLSSTPGARARNILNKLTFVLRFPLKEKFSKISFLFKNFRFLNFETKASEVAPSFMCQFFDDFQLFKPHVILSYCFFQVSTF